MGDDVQENLFSVLKNYGEDLTIKKYLSDPSIARDNELKKLMMVLKALFVFHIRFWSLTTVSGFRILKCKLGVVEYNQVTCIPYLLIVFSWDSKH